MAGTAREEAERLVATVLAMAGRSGLGGGAGTGAWATGSAECCVCPVCRVIAGLRDPHPMTAERLATGAGDVATGVASLLRAASAMAGNVRQAAERPPAERQPAPPTAERPVPPFDPNTTWSAATRTADAQPADAQPPDAAPAAGAPRSAERPDGDVWAAATGDHGAAGTGTVDHDGTGA